MSAAQKSPELRKFASTVDDDVAGFNKLTNLLRTKTGINIVLSEKNKSLVSSRLAKILTKYNLSSYSQYAKALAKGDPKMMTEFVNSLTTNTTQFFRESKHFEFLDTYLKDSKNFDVYRNKRQCRVWCAASSTGQEIYTTLITMLNTGQFSNSNINLKALSTDIDSTVLETAVRGIYPEKQTEDIPKYFLSNYFSKDKKNKTYEVKNILANKVTFAKFNLLTPTYPFKHKFDFIFCRNVLIYFENPQTVDIVGKMVDCLEIGGLLFVGHSESGLVQNPKLEKVTFGVYKRVK